MVREHEKDKKGTCMYSYQLLFQQQKQQNGASVYCIHVNFKVLYSYVTISSEKAKPKPSNTKR